MTEYQGNVFLTLWHQLLNRYDFFSNTHIQKNNALYVGQDYKPFYLFISYTKYG